MRTETWQGDTDVLPPKPLSDFERVMTRRFYQPSDMAWKWVLVRMDNVFKDRLERIKAVEEKQADEPPKEDEVTLNPPPEQDKPAGADLRLFNSISIAGHRVELEEVVQALQR